MLAMINSAAMNIGVHVSLSILVSSVCMPRSGIAGSYGSSISSLLLFNSTYTIVWTHSMYYSVKTLSCHLSYFFELQLSDM